MSALPLPTPPDPEPLTAEYINAARRANGIVALHRLPAIIRALERGAALVPDCDTKALMYAEAARARALLAETP